MLCFDRCSPDHAHGDPVREEEEQRFLRCNALSQSEIVSGKARRACGRLIFLVGVVATYMMARDAIVMS